MRPAGNARTPIRSSRPLPRPIARSHMSASRSPNTGSRFPGTPPWFRPRQRFHRSQLPHQKRPCRRCLRFHLSHLPRRSRSYRQLHPTRRRFHSCPSWRRFRLFPPTPASGGDRGTLSWPLQADASALTSASTDCRAAHGYFDPQAGHGGVAARIVGTSGEAEAPSRGANIAQGRGLGYLLTPP